MLDFLEKYNGAISALAAISVAAFTFALVWVTGRLARLTRVAAEAAETSSKTAKDALITTERAFVFLDELEPEWAAEKDILFRVTCFIIKPLWRNNGTTPTKNMKVQVNWTHWMGPILPDGFSYEYGEAPTQMFLGPQATEWSAPINNIPQHVITAALEGSGYVFVWGRVDYEDIFDGTRPHFTQWCYRLNLSADEERVQLHTQFTAHGNYNGSDEDARSQ